MLRALVRTSPDGADRVADELTWTVKGDVATTIDGHLFSTDRTRIHEHVRRISVGPERVDRTVLEQEQIVVFGPGGQGALQVPRLAVGDAAQPPSPDHGTAQAVLVAVDDRNGVVVGTVCEKVAVTVGQSSLVQSRSSRMAARRAKKRAT